jgi:hypothetical protein
LKQRLFTIPYRPQSWFTTQTVFQPFLAMPAKRKGRRRVKRTKPTIFHAAREGLVNDLAVFLQQGANVNEIV